MISRYIKEFGKKVKASRLQHGWSQFALATEMAFELDELGIFRNEEAVNRQTISKYERGMTSISLERALILASILELDFEDLIPRELATTVYGK